MIPVTRPYLPSREKLDRYLDGIYERNWLTNNGPLVQELTRRLEAYLGVENLLLVANGTLALQIAYRALGISGKALTTAFSFIATASSLQWEGIQPAFVDIDPASLCFDPAAAEKQLARGVSALVPVHVYGNACDVEAIERLAAERGLKVVYDAAHAFGVKYKGRSILSYGDASTLSFHATKLFHTIEGGAIVFREKAALERAKLLINFGIPGPDAVIGLGINAKMNEMQAAMGLCVLDEIGEIFAQREAVWSHYERVLAGRLERPVRNPHATNNFAYYPVLFPAEKDLLAAVAVLEAAGVATRRYFYPSLDTLAFLGAATPAQHSQAIAKRVLCLPMYVGLDAQLVTSVEGWCKVGC
jgi:dTDP-4-amino-4,6-dideoxygalactose transaminase